MLINFTETYQFATRLQLKDENVEVINSTKLLGTIIYDDLKRDTQNLVKKADARMALLRKVASFGAPLEDLKTIYVLFIRSILEQSATVWHSSLSEENIKDLKGLRIKEKYKGYKQSLSKIGLED